MSVYIFVAVVYNADFYSNKEGTGWVMEMGYDWLVRDGNDWFVERVSVKGEGSWVDDEIYLIYIVLRSPTHRAQPGSNN